MAHPKHQSVRVRYNYQCGYCGISEIDAGGELTVDHYHPVARGGDDSDDNLVYACVRCNLYKSDYWPDAKEITSGYYVLHPILNEIEYHIHQNELTGELDALSETGRFHIVLLDLNRPQLITHRQRARIQALSAEILQTLREELTDLRAEVDAYTHYASQLEHLLGIQLE